MPRNELYEKPAEAENQVKNKESLLDAEDVFNELRKKYVNDKEVGRVSKRLIAKHIKAFKKLGNEE
jgi:hypothetical protein